MNSIFNLIFEHITLVFWFLIFLQPLCVLCYRFFTAYRVYPQTQSQRHNAYLIMDKDEVRGLMVGTIHLALSAEEAKPWISLVRGPSKYSAVFTEVPLPHHTLLQTGLERHLLAALENDKIPFLGLENDRSAQVAAVYGMDRIFNRMVGAPFPYWLIQKMPWLSYGYSLLRKIALFPITIIQNIFFSGLNQQALIEDRDMISQFRKDLFSGSATIIRYDTADALYLKERDIIYAQKISDYLRQDRSHHPLIMIGIAHLSEQGILYEELLKHGWSLVPTPCLAQNPEDTQVSPSSEGTS